MTGRERHALVWLLLAALAAPGGSARAAQRTPIQPLGLTDTGGELYLRGNFKSVTQTASDGTKSVEDDKFFEETLELRGRGYVYHPNLLDWFGSVRLGLTQQEITIDQQKQSSSGNLLGYNLSGLFLREKAVSASVFSSQSQQMIDRDFASSTKLEYGRTGVQLLKKGDLPMSLLVERVTMKEDSGLRLDDRTTDHLRFTAADQRNPNRLLELIYDREAVDETIITRPLGVGGGGASETDRFPYTRDELNLNGLVRFGPADLQSRFGAHARMMDRVGTFPDRVREGDASLDLAHTKTFSTFYRGLYLLDETDTDRDVTTNAEVGFTKHIYESLDITGRLIANDRQLQDGSQKTRGGFLDFAYRKETPVGQLNLGLMLGRENTDQSAPSGQLFIRGQSITLTGTTFFPLGHANVLTGSILVTNVARTITYVEGTDYELRITGSITEIARIPAGAILDGQEVLVDFTILTSEQATWTTDHLNWTNRLQLKDLPLAFYYNYHLRDDNLVSGLDPGNLDRQRGHLAGVELSLKDLQVVLEREIRDQLLFPPWTADRVRAHYTWRPTRDVDVAVGGGAEHLVYRNIQQFDLEPGQDTMDSLNGYGRLTAKLRADLLGLLEVEYLKTSGRENRKLTRLSVGVEWHYRDLDLSIQAREAAYQQEQNSGTTESIMFILRRRF